MATSPPSSIIPTLGYNVERLHLSYSHDAYERTSRSTCIADEDYDDDDYDDPDDHDVDEIDAEWKIIDTEHEKDDKWKSIGEYFQAHRANLNNNMTTPRISCKSASNNNIIRRTIASLWNRIIRKQMRNDTENSNNKMTMKNNKIMMSLEMWDIFHCYALWQHFMNSKTHGIIYVVSSVEYDEERFERSYQSFQYICSNSFSFDIPILLLVNKQDHPDAKNVNDIEAYFFNSLTDHNHYHGDTKTLHQDNENKSSTLLPRRWYIQSCSAIDNRYQKGIKDGLDWLCHEMMSSQLKNHDD